MRNTKKIVGEKLFLFRRNIGNRKKRRGGPITAVSGVNYTVGKARLNVYHTVREVSYFATIEPSAVGLPNGGRG